MVWLGHNPCIREETRREGITWYII